MCYRSMWQEQEDRHDGGAGGGLNSAACAFDRMREWRVIWGVRKEKKTEGVHDILSVSGQNKQSASEHVEQKEEGDQ